MSEEQYDDTTGEYEQDPASSENLNTILDAASGNVEEQSLNYLDQGNDQQQQQQQHPLEEPSLDDGSNLDPQLYDQTGEESSYTGIEVTQLQEHHVEEVYQEATEEASAQEGTTSHIPYDFSGLEQLVTNGEAVYAGPDEYALPADMAGAAEASQIQQQEEYVPPVRSLKRKRSHSPPTEELTGDQLVERRIKITKTLKEHLVLAAAPKTFNINRMCTVECVFPGAAQKSYGKEHRFLTPAPIVTLSGPIVDLADEHAEPGQSTRGLVATMSIVSSNFDEEYKRQKVQIKKDGNRAIAFFGGLHVEKDATQGKSMALQLVLGEEGLKTDSSGLTLPIMDEDEEDVLHPPSRPWATLDLAQVKVISKPSVKSDKSKLSISNLYNGQSVAFYTRINSQTYRTKFLCMDQGRLSATASEWTNWIIRVVEPDMADFEHFRTKLPLPSDSELTTPLTYGTTVILVDYKTGYSTEPHLLVKIEKKNLVDRSNRGIVCQMHKVGLVKVQHQGEIDQGGVRKWFLSSAGNGSKGGIPSTTREDDRLSYDALALKPNTSKKYEEDRGRLVGYSEPEPNVFGENGDELEIVDDWMAWTINGIARTSYTFFDATQSLNSVNPFPQKSISPVPALVVNGNPTYDVESSVLHLKIQNYFTYNEQDPHFEPIQIFIGSFGPLPIVYSDGDVNNAFVAVGAQCPEPEQLIKYFQNQPPASSITADGTLNTSDPLIQCITTADAETDNSARVSNLDPSLVADLLAYADEDTSNHQALQMVTSSAMDLAERPKEPDESTVAHHGLVYPQDMYGFPMTAEGEPIPLMKKVKLSDLDGTGNVEDVRMNKDLPILFVRELTGVGYHSGKCLEPDGNYLNDLHAWNFSVVNPLPL